MSLQEVLASIRTSGEAQVLEIEQRTNTQIREIRIEAEAEARDIKAEVISAAIDLANSERTRILHQARLENLHFIGRVRETLITATLDQTRGRLGNLRAEKLYPAILHNLVQEALAEMEDSTNNIGRVIIEADQRDQDLLLPILEELGQNMTINFCLVSWGGLILRSEDGRIVVINTLEARLERVIPYLRHYLAAFYENSH